MSETIRTRVRMPNGQTYGYSISEKAIGSAVWHDQNARIRWALHAGAEVIAWDAPATPVAPPLRLTGPRSRGEIELHSDFDALPRTVRFDDGVCDPPLPQAAPATDTNDA